MAVPMAGRRRPVDKAFGDAGAFDLHRRDHLAFDRIDTPQPPDPVRDVLVNVNPPDPARVAR